MRASRLGAGSLALGLAVGASLGACLATSPRHTPVAAGASSPRAPLVVAAPDPWSTSGHVPLRLTSLEGRDELVVDVGTGASERLARRGDAVVGADGRAATHLVVEPRAGASGVRIDGRLYAGRLLVEVREGGGLRSHAWLELEEYVAGVVAAELALWNAPPALLEAQAIAARSYAVAQLDARASLSARPFLQDGVLDQAFRGRYEPDAAASKRRVDAALAAAIAATRGRVLESAGAVLDARFHASCGGHTAAFGDVFPERDPGAMPSVACSTCAASAARWNHTFTATELAALASAHGVGTRLVALEPAASDAHGRWTRVRLVGDAGRADVALSDVRRALDWQRWRSGVVRRTWPPDGRLTAGLYVEGTGHGHGVGLCQNGARGMAERGASSGAILAHYYPGARLARLAR